MRRAISAKRMRVNVRDKKTDELFGVARSSAFSHDNYILNHAVLKNAVTAYPNNSGRRTE